MGELYVIRHGETEWNRERRYQGQLDSPLTDSGRRKIGEQRDLLKGIQFKSVYCSPLGRCRQTLEILDPKTESCSYDDRLLEFNLGILQGKTHREVPECFQQQQRLFWENPESFHLEGAETFTALETRVGELLKVLRKSNGSSLVITHTVVIKMISKILDGKPLRNLWDEPYIFPGTLIRFRRGKDSFLLDKVFHPQGQEETVKAYIT